MTQASDGYDNEHMEMALIDIIHQALKKFESPNIKKISYDGDNKSCELIITMRVDDTEADYLISSEDILEVVDDEEDEEDGK